VALPPQRPGRGDPNANGDARDPVADRHATEQLSDDCGRLEEELERLRARYEMYFLGVERREPNRDRDELKRRIERIKTAFTRNTGLKFRLQSLGARFLSYERMWVRSTREREEGTYRRDLFRLRRHAQERGVVSETSSAQPGVPASAAVPVAETGKQAPAAPPPTPAAAPAPSSSAGDAQMRALYDAYIVAKKRCNEDVSRLTFESVTKSVQKQIPDLLAKYKAKAIEFKVVVQGGKAVLKVIPKT
jgi:hypothetical protein